MNAIVNPSQLTRKIVCTPIDKEWKQNLKNFWWATNSICKPVPNTEKEAEDLRKMFALRDRLLEFGGEEVCLPAPDDRDAIVERGSFCSAIMECGQFFYGDGEHVSFVPDGNFARCASDAANVENKCADSGRMCAGYGLTSDGMWRQHVWFVFPEKEDWHIVEFAAPHVAYFGVILTDEEADKFEALTKKK